ncbi:MAG TPA: hypothetical protein VKD90_16555, partial [Gemmataceae bacterium]|nr:hypothetical protein [Gemmataceae bacterium]
SVTLGRPTLYGPDGETNTRRPTFTWGGVAFAPAYQLRIDDLTSGEAAVYSATTGSLDWTPPDDLIVDHTYRWYVRALNGSDLGVWSPGQTFWVV